jgi:AraC-like DNA-binding protein
MTVSHIEHAVRRVIDDMHVNLGEDLTIDDMAQTAMFSKFHFTRMFRELTGTSPGRFLCALRLQEAKRLLVTTDSTVADISSQVGYSSVGTFSSRFKACVGLSPSMYRDNAGFAPAMTSSPTRTGDGAAPMSLRGQVLFDGGGTPGQVFVGLFPDSVPQGRPVRFAVLDGPGAFELPDVPPGTWYAMAYSVPYGQEHVPWGTGDLTAVSVGRYGPVTFQTGMLLLPADMTLRPLDRVDPPMLLALPDLRRYVRRTIAA